MPVKRKAKIREHMMLARKLLKHLYGNKNIRVKSLSGGLSNYVFSASLPGDDLIVRLSDKQEKITGFLKEQWAVDRARQYKIPVLDILEVGNEIIPLPYMVVRKIKGESAIDYSERRHLLHDMGKLAAKINAIPPPKLVS